MGTRRESMIFYASWYDAIAELPDAVRKEVLDAVIEYGLFGEMPAEQGAMTRAMMALIKPQIDANNVRWENGCKGGEFGKLGGAPVGNQNARKTTPKQPQNNPKTTPNEYEYEYVNVNDNESVCEKNAHTRTHEEEIFQKFTDWCATFAPDSLKFVEPLSLEGYVWLVTKYGGNRMMQCASDMHSKGAYKRNKNALNCWKKWIERV